MRMGTGMVDRKWDGNGNSCLEEIPVSLFATVVRCSFPKESCIWVSSWVYHRDIYICNCSNKPEGRLQCPRFVQDTAMHKRKANNDNNNEPPAKTAKKRLMLDFQDLWDDIGTCHRNEKAEYVNTKIGRCWDHWVLERQSLVVSPSCLLLLTEFYASQQRLLQAKDFTVWQAGCLRCGEHALQGGLVLAKIGRLERGDNILRKMIGLSSTTVMSLVSKAVAFLSHPWGKGNVRHSSWAHWKARLQTDGQTNRRTDRRTDRHLSHR